ncbi:MAG: lasso peptide biosynthesis B2 protein [Egibacteraceae bacterium]
MRLPLAEQLTTVRVLATAVPVEVAVHMVPLPRLVRWLGFTMATRDGDAQAEPVTGVPSPPFDPVEQRQVRTVLEVMRRWPFGHGACLRQALLLGHLLRPRSPVLYLGVNRRGPQITAHAWLQVSGLVIGAREGFLPLIQSDGLQ